MKTILIDAIDAFVVENSDGVFEIYKPLQDLLNKYDNDKIILTGANDEQYKAFGLDKMPYKVFTLKHNPEKSVPEYYRILLREFELNASDTIYFEHNPEAVSSAESAGIKTFYWDNEVRPIAELEEFFNNNL